MTRLTFPRNFLWGVATSAHQIEGGNDLSDWWRWEQDPGRIRNREKSGRAAGHWDRIDEDVRLIRDLGCNAYRFSVEWSRLESNPGEWNAASFDHYRAEIERLRVAGIRPFVTLHHFTSPQWFADRGGWEWEGAPEAFGRFAGKVFEELGEGVDLWVTINEPMVQVVLGYLGLNGRPFPPGVDDPIRALRALRGLLAGHAKAYRAIHALAAGRRAPVRVGLAHHFRVLDVKGLSPLNRMVRFLADRFFNWSIPTAVEAGKLNVLLPGKRLFPIHRVAESIPGLAGSQDFVGVNYYSRDFVRFGMAIEEATIDLKGEDRSRTDVGWEIYPPGLGRVIRSLARRFPGKPVIITENGLADASDRNRARFIVEHLREVHEAIREGVNVEGYFHWSLMDNFEWVEGFEPRFGLYEVDYETLDRRRRPSASAFAKICQENGFFYPFEI